MADLQHVIQQTLDELVDSGLEAGLQAAVYQDGVLVADCVAGVVAQDSSTLVNSDTLFTIFSASKGVIATACHVLAERGLFAYDKPVAHYWPEFAIGGKDEITIAQVMNHTAGIPQAPVLPEVPHAELWADSSRAIEETAKLSPMFPPGTTACYHALTIGWILDGLVRRIDGRTMAEVVREEIATPLGIEDELFLGTPSSQHERMATVSEPPIDPDDLPDMDPDSIAFKVIPPTDERFGAIFNRPRVRSAEIPAANVSATARALACHYAALVSEIDGCQLVSLDHFKSLFAHRSDLPDKLFNAQFDGVQTPRVLGYHRSTALRDQVLYYGPSEYAVGHEGYGGSVGFADPDRKLGVGYTKTTLRRLIKDDTTGKMRGLRPEELSKMVLTKAIFDTLAE
jgi:CubicO group peptidase (beta-lactamase class C family)